MTGAGGARRAQGLTERLLAAERARGRAIISSSTQVEVELTLAAQPAGLQVAKLPVLRCSRSRGSNRDARDHHDDSVTDKLTCTEK
jgi:hypothetical protein